VCQERFFPENQVFLMTSIWNDVTFEELRSVFSDWIQRVTWVNGHGGSIVMNNYHSFLKEFSLMEKAKGPGLF
jgi:hypothetical protein